MRECWRNDDDHDKPNCRTTSPQCPAQEDRPYDRGPGWGVSRLGRLRHGDAVPVLLHGRRRRSRRRRTRSAIHRRSCLAPQRRRRLGAWRRTFTHSRSPEREPSRCISPRRGCRPGSLAVSTISTPRSPGRSNSPPTPGRRRRSRRRDVADLPRSSSATRPLTWRWCGTRRSVDSSVSMMPRSRRFAVVRTAKRPSRSIRSGRTSTRSSTCATSIDR